MNVFCSHKRLKNSQIFRVVNINAFVLFEYAQHFKFVKMQSFMENKKSLGQKIPRLGIFR